MSINKIGYRIIDGTTTLGASNINPIIEKINEIIDAGVQPATTKILIAGEADNNSHGNISVHGLNKEDLNCPAYYAEVGEYVVLHAKGATSDYTFSHWATSTGAVESTLPDRTILVDSSMQSGKTFKAVFVGTTVNLSVTSADAGKGSVSGGGNVTKGSTATLVATPIVDASIHKYYQFKEWQVKNGGSWNKIDGAGATYQVTANADAEYRAVFEAKPIGAPYVTIQPTTDGFKLTQLTAANAKQVLIKEAGVTEPYALDITKEYTTAITLTFIASNDVTGAASVETNLIRFEYDKDKETGQYTVYAMSGSTRKDFYVKYDTDVELTAQDIENNNYNEGFTADDEEVLTLNASTHTKYSIWSEGQTAYIELVNS